MHRWPSHLVRELADHLSFLQPLSAMCLRPQARGVRFDGWSVTTDRRRGERRRERRPVLLDTRCGERRRGRGRRWTDRRGGRGIDLHV